MFLDANPPQENQLRLEVSHIVSMPWPFNHVGLESERKEAGIHQLLPGCSPIYLGLALLKYLRIGRALPEHLLTLEPKESALTVPYKVSK